MRRFDHCPDVEYSCRVACRTGVLFENSIVCLVVFVCCLFLPHLAVPVVGCGFFVTFGDFVRFL